MTPATHRRPEVVVREDEEAEAAYQAALEEALLRALEESQREEDPR